jgi:NAD(P)-dependent dehydrogenase (short-subunit alcohol dehydrogenase family)
MEQNNYGGALQRPVGSGFNARSTTSDVIKGIDLTGKIAIVTGGYAGIGLETTKVLSAAGASVIVPARSLEKAKANLAEITNVEIEEMDLTNPASIDAFAEKFLSSGRPLHLLVNNAGIQLSGFKKDPQGNEAHFSANYLGHFHLTARLWSALKKAKGARVVNLSSYAHRLASFNFDDPNYTKREFDAVQAYGQSKTAINLFTVELDNLGKAFNIRAFAAHPGSVGGTDLSRDFSFELGLKMGFIDAQGNVLPQIASILKTVPQGAATSVWCATSPLLNNIGGVYCEDADIAILDTNNHEDSSTTIAKGVKLYSLEERNAKRLWELSSEMTSVTYRIH